MSKNFLTNTLKLTMNKKSSLPKKTIKIEQRHTKNQGCLEKKVSKLNIGV